SFAKKTFAELAEQIPRDAAEILLPGAQRAIVALESLQDGFFIRRHAGTANVEWTDPLLGPCAITPAVAAAQYIKVLRDSTHGHGSNRSSRIGQTNALLTHHNGAIPHDLALLGY